ncbi:hypothetical protein GCM10011610_70540 [Nocardia rhizosphaerihabitans]|uniref:Mce-associated membrane protein n=1 Tax=Nocardia rhizosphaerihabitans TaxID=1691570 RepID=A0ABQ2L5W5_9NOCA|nr:hypothetical protein GCM10011610_70540 [Nocardia rhizosphaerihabitans]
MAITSDQVDVAEVASDSGAGEPPPRQALPWRVWAIAVLAAAVVALGGVSVQLWLDVRHNEQVDSRDEAVLDTARRIAVQLVTLDHTSAEKSLDAIGADSTGSFRDQWDKISGNFVTVLRNGNVESTGEVKEAGIVAIDDNNATVLTAVTSMVKNTEAPEGQQRVYRMKMTLDHTDGRWLVSNVEFVA